MPEAHGAPTFRLGWWVQAETGLRLRKAHSEPWSQCGIQMRNEGPGEGVGKLSIHLPPLNQFPTRQALRMAG